jgi:choice-of-anchor B domain-containing protein
LAIPTQSSVKTTRLLSLPCATLAVLAIVSPLVAHDDDPKARYRQAPVYGPGFRASSPTGPGGPQGSAGFDADGVTLEAWLPLNQLDNSSSGNDCWGYVSPSGREYAIIGTERGTNFVEITDPSNPVVIDWVDGPDSLWRDIKTYQNYAYAVSEGGSGIQVMNLANIDSGNVTLSGTVTGPGTTATHNVAIDEVSGYLYRLGGSSEGMRIFSLANPANPSYVGSWSSRYIHDAQVVTYTSGPNAGKQVVFACGGLNGGFDQTGLTVVDVTNKSNIQVLDQVFYPNSAYSHQGWLSPDLNYFYLGDEIDEDGVTPSTTHMFNVSNLSNVTYAGSFNNGLKASTHNLYTKDSRIFAANYTSGLRIFDASNPTNPTEVAYFDTYPGSNSDGYNGLWNVYPYFPSGTVIGSDLERGLFVWSVEEPTIIIELPGGPPDLIDPSGESLAVTISETNPGDLAAGSAKLVYDIGSGATEVPMIDNGGGSFTATFPSLTCGLEAAWYLQAEDTAGKAWRLPSSAPATTYTSLIAEDVDVVVDHDMESDQGWTVGAPNDTATTGIWTRVNPRGTEAQPEDDHSNPGTDCWVTGQGPVGGSVGDNDVDGGKTTLYTPVLDLASYNDPSISYWRWYSNSAGASPNADTFRVALSDNGGSSFTNVETVGPTGEETSGGWYQYTFRVADILAPTNQMQLRFVAEDAGDGSIVEAAVDDFQVFETVCSFGPGTNYCVATANSSGAEAFTTGLGSNVVADNDLTMAADLMAWNKFGYFIASQTQGFVQPPGSQGNLCLSGSIKRYAQNVMNTGPFGSFSMAVDLTAIPGHGAVVVGETWNFQAWFRDNNPGQTSNFTDGYSILFQ